MVRIAINGFGRIGRMVFRAGMHDPQIEFVAVNDLTDNATLAHLLKYDSVHGILDEQVSTKDDTIVVGKKKLLVFEEKDPAKLPWDKLDIDIVVESTGFFRTKETMAKHIEAGAKRVVLCAPAKGEGVPTYVLGINEHSVDPSKDVVLSNASCTTNCLAPVLKVLNDNFEIESGFFNTIHSYTADQRHIDGPHKDLRRARACAVNIAPTSSGAAIAATLTIPELKGKLTGLAVRVPTPDGSLTDFTCTVKKSTSVEEVNALFKNVAEHHLKGIIRYSEEPLVSSDIIGDPHSCIFDAKSTQVLNGNHIRVLAWYDNEWGYSNRIIDLVKLVSS